MHIITIDLGLSMSESWSNESPACIGWSSESFGIQQGGSLITNNWQAYTWMCATWFESLSDRNYKNSSSSYKKENLWQHLHGFCSNYSETQTWYISNVGR
jgi:hypothetical protein